MASPQLPQKTIAGVRVVDTPIVRAAIEYAQAHSDDMIFNHVMRTWIFGVIIHRGLFAKGKVSEMDLEAHALAAVLHDLGWDVTDELVSKDKRFEVDGAFAARSWIEEQQKNGLAANWDERRLQLVWDAIAIHGVPSIARFKEPVVSAVTFGAGADFRGPESDITGIITWDDFNAVNEAFPRHELTEGVRRIMIRLCRTKPETTWGELLRFLGASA
ncbi:uncharacterized protein B0I36DRAFT_238422 [Microdochium trichocladiopsis]|uniref:HD domain-containing protein n=1 Tax=Microdochium trichocladiopsis TaxID=1682393 RepID=A0A9P9BVY5_9PEZI|nr:uncharacterized protein B0I36DRAFT_238422 [Microdochium trichocladiopsis]KAH7034516.1 hypothetical protein B0I36DRAFT_238422 [Microdochium trichocladiopsis]